MTKQHFTKPEPKAGKGILRIALFLFLFFFVNLLVGKSNVSFHWGLPQLGSVAEFLLLGAASTVLIWAALKREAAERKITETNAKEV
jgi:heme A synthase